MSTKVKLLSLLILLVGIPFALFAQDATGRVVGTITDPSGGAVPNVSVSVLNTSTHVARVTKTDHDGNYQVLNLPIGLYSVKVEAPGFATTEVAAAELRINQSLRFDVRLELSATKGVVQVESGATAVETVNSSLGGSVTNSSIVNMPLNGRNVMDLVGLQAGATETRPGGPPGLYSISGGRTDSVTYLLDGAVNNDLLNNSLVANPNPDMIEEFRVITSNGTAEYGRNAGGIVSAVIKSGTNGFHGTVYDYLRNEKFNANRFFRNEQGLERDILKRNQFGGTINGPIVIPHVIDGHEKYFFSLGYQGQRQSKVLTQSGFTVFTPNELNGDFSKSVDGGPDPNVAGFLQNHPEFQSNPTLAAQAIIDPGHISPVALNYIKAGLIPSAASGIVFPAGSETDNNDEFTGKVDLNVTQNDRIAVMLSARRRPVLEPFSTTGYSSGVPGLPYTNKSNTYFGDVSYTKVLSPNVLNEFRFGAQRSNSLQGVPATKAPTAAELGMAITPDLPTGPPLLWFSSGLTVGAPGQGPTNLISTTYNLSDNLSWTRGRHTFKTGFNTTIFQNNMAYDFLGNGGFDFYGPDGSASGNDLADFLFGLPDDFIEYPNAPTNIRTKNYAGFAQDEWRVTPHFVLTFGLRYEYSTPKYDTQGRSFSLALGKQSTVFTNAPEGILFPGDAGAPRGANFPDKNDFAPRFGFAWSPGLKTSIRGGFGMYYDILKAEDNLQFNGQTPFYSAVFFNLPASDAEGNLLPLSPQQLSDPYGAAGRTNPFPSKPPTKNVDFSNFLPLGGNGVYFVDPHLRTPYVYQYNLTVQHEVAHDLVAEVAYVGNSSHKLTSLVDSNPFVPGTDRRLFNGAGDNFNYLLTFANVGMGNYNSLQTMLEKRLSDVRGLGSVSFKLSYTYGHAIDTAGGFREKNNGTVPAYNTSLFRASGDEDIRHNLSLAGSWELPFAKAWAKGPKRLTSGWTLYPMLSWRTGFALDVLAGLYDQMGDPGPSGAGDGANVRANLVGSGVTLYNPQLSQKIGSHTGNYWFSPDNFSPDVVSGYGTLGRNAFRGPGRTNVDLALLKDTSLWGERVKCQFRVEGFNIFNHPQWLQPSTNIVSSLFGQVTDTYDPRILQLALRFQF